MNSSFMGNIRINASVIAKTVIKVSNKNTKMHCVKSIRISKLSGPYFPTFGMNTEIYFSPNAGKYGPEKLRMRTLFTQ